MIVIAAVLAIAPATASAQGGPVTAYVDAVDAWATAARLQQLLPNSGRAGEAARRRTRVRKATPKQLRRLRIKRRASVTRSNNQQVAAQLPGVDPAIVAADIERNRDLAHRRIRSFGWNRNNLADVAAFALLSAYSAYHDRDRLSARGSRAVRRAARHGLARSRKLRRVSAREKQTAAEMTEVRMIYAIAELIRARAGGDAADISIAESEIRIWVRDVFHLDVSTVRLTSRGFRSF